MSARCFLTIAICLVAVPFHAWADGRDGLHALCWNKSQLASKASEIKPKSYVKAARIRAPKASLVAFNAIPQGLQGVIRRVKITDGRKLVALTFDLCEQSHEVAGYDGRIVDILRQNNVKATFFSSGKWFLSHQERAAQLLTDPLFEIANHGWSHRNMKGLNRVRLKREITNAQKAYEVTRKALEERMCLQPAKEKLHDVPRRMGLFRYPFGTCSPAAVKAVNEAGLLAVQWDISTGDPWRGQSRDRIVRTVMSRVKPGSIVLAHANGRGWNTWRALPILIQRLKHQGYEFVTVSELLAAGTPEIVTRCYDQRYGDTERWVQRAYGRKIRNTRAKAR